MEAESPAARLRPRGCYIHAGMGVQVSQLITDFGRTPNLVASAKLQEKARLADAEASREDIVLATDQVFYAVIEAQETVEGCGSDCLCTADSYRSGKRAHLIQVEVGSGSELRPGQPCPRQSCYNSTRKTISMRQKQLSARCWATTNR